MDWAMDPVASTTLIVGLATLVVGFGTWWLAWLTNKLVKLETRPCLAMNELQISVKRLDTNLNIAMVRVGVKLHNPGKVPVQYQVESFVAVVNAQTRDNPKFETNSGLIMPSDSVGYSFSEIERVDVSKLPVSGTLTSTIAYWAQDGAHLYRVHRKHNFTILSLDPRIAVENIFLEQQDSGPERRLRTKSVAR